ncbi:MAG: CvpA family protein [Candidatus Desulfofervidaceae bacterium]|nr:CvpA family protein [Candidatus Desulfofervidaceae bacterium]MDL1971225.1 CvpA family protein [Candidatus Desulfofervidaceae bacterium]
MNPIDILVFILVGIFLLLNGINGFIKSLSFLIGLVAGFWLAGRYAAKGALMLNTWMHTPFSYIVSFILIFLVVFLAAQLGGFFLKAIFKPKILSWLDHTLGCLLGFVKGVIIATLILVVVNMFHPLPQNLIKNSYTYPYLCKISRWMATKLPKKLQLKPPSKQFFWEKRNGRPI